MSVSASARSVSRVSNWQVKPTCSTTSGGMPKSVRIESRTPLSAGSFMTIDSVPLGSMSRSFLSMRIARCGAWPARANVFRTSPERWPLGWARWKAWPSSPSAWAMWSIALAT